MSVSDHPETWIGISALAVTSWTSIAVAFIGYLRYRDGWKRRSQQLTDKLKAKDEMLKARKEKIDSLRKELVEARLEIKELRDGPKTKEASG